MYSFLLCFASTICICCDFMDVVNLLELEFSFQNLIQKQTCGQMLFPYCDTPTPHSQSLNAFYQLNRSSLRSQVCPTSSAFLSEVKYRHKTTSCDIMKKEETCQDLIVIKVAQRNVSPQLRKVRELNRAHRSRKVGIASLLPRLTQSKLRALILRLHGLSLRCCSQGCP